MKIFIDTIKWVILKEEKESPFFEGENFASKLRIYVNDNGDSYPTLSLLKANGRKRGPFNYDASGYGTEVVDGIEWNYYDFTLSTINGALDVPGQLLMTCIINTNGSQRAFNFTNNVVKTAIDTDSGIIVYGDEPTDIINDIGKNLDTYQKSVDDHNKAIVNIREDLNGKVSTEEFEETINSIKNSLDNKEYHSINLTRGNTLQDLMNELNNRYVFYSKSIRRFYIKLSGGLNLTDIVINKQFDTYFVNSTISDSSGTFIYQNENPVDLNITISEFINLHKQIAVEEQIPTKVSQLTNDNDFIDNTVNNLINYYKKSETYTQEEINNLVSSIPKFDIQVVSSLPTSNISSTTVYLISGGEDTNLYTEWIYVKNKWELLGSQKVDLTNYALKTDVLNIIDNNSKEVEELTFGNSSSVNWEDDTQVPSSKSVKDYVDSVLGDIESLLGGI